MLDYIAYILLRILNKIFALIPISASLWLARRLGGMAFFFNKKRRLIAYANLKAAFCKERSPGELKVLTKRVYQNLFETLMEILNLTKVNKGYIDKYVEVVNLKRIQDASKSGRGAILLTAHFGDWELSSLVGALIGFPILVLAREQKMKKVNELLNRLRESKGCKVVRKGPSTKNILKALHGKDIVGILADQDAGRNGLFVNFFGRPTSTHSGPMEMAKRTDSIILPNFIVRTKGPYHKLYLEEYIDFMNSKGSDDVRENMQKFATLLESYIRRYPEQWLWLHKRWKSTPTRTVMVLNDGRAGHLNQSLAIARAIQRARATQGYKMGDTKIIVVEVKFKNPFFKSALSLCANFAGWRCHGCMRCMRLCLDEDTYKALMESYAEFIVSCGSGLAPVNIFMSKENNARNFIVMKPHVLFWRKKFSLAVIPKHDRSVKARNVVVTTIAPNLIDMERMKSDGDELKKHIGLEKESSYAGLLIGGDNPEFSLDKDRMKEVIDNLLRFCEEKDTGLLVTTSRRTSPEVEAVLKDRLKDNPRCKLLVIANERNLDAAVGGILYLSKVVVVSGESISMVSEAMSSGKRVIAFELQKRTKGLTKHETALKDLERNGYLKISKPEDLFETLRKAWEDTAPVKGVDDRDRIFGAVRRLI